LRLDSALARSLRDHGTDTIFGLLADPTMRFADSFVREHGGTYISAIHEAGATHMAYGYGVASGRLGVGLIDLGPGLTNSLTAVVDAVKARVPLLLLYPDTNVEMRHHRQSVPQREFIVPTGAGFEEVRSVRTALMDLALAIRRTLFEHRPIALNIPREFLPVEIEYERTVLDSTPVPSVVVDEESLDMAVGIIASSRRPVVVAGRGAITARSEVLRLAERIGAPVATSLGAKDLFRGEPFDLGIMGNLSNAATLDVISEADCIVAIGAGLNDDTTAKGSVLENKRTIHCDINPARLGNFSKVDSMVLGDAADIATRIVEWLDEGEIPSSSFRSPAMAQKLQEERARVDVGLGAGQQDRRWRPRSSLLRILARNPRSKSTRFHSYRALWRDRHRGSDRHWGRMRGPASSRPRRVRRRSVHAWWLERVQFCCAPRR
jgi:acetolactate synthase-1/2/3 large subunit